jgi:hypothetical protein
VDERGNVRADGDVAEADQPDCDRSGAHACDPNMRY